MLEFFLCSFFVQLLVMLIGVWMSSNMLGRVLRQELDLAWCRVTDTFNVSIS